jgi:GNAT superfamily N-acetyltransferase
VHDIRPVEPLDLDLICRHREQMFLESGRPPDLVAAMAEPFRTWLEQRLADGRYFGWLIEEDGIPIAGIGMMEIDWPPHPLHPSDARRGYVLNVYVEPPFRRRGLARKLMETAQADAAKRGLHYAILHATAQARPLYEALGWTATAEMALSISDRLD